MNDYTVLIMILHDISNYLFKFIAIIGFVQKVCKLFLARKWSFVQSDVSYSIAVIQLMNVHVVISSRWSCYTSIHSLEYPK